MATWRTGNKGVQDKDNVELEETPPSEKPCLTLCCNLSHLGFQATYGTKGNLPGNAGVEKSRGFETTLVSPEDFVGL